MSVLINASAEVRDAADIRVVTPQFRPEFAAIVMVRGDDSADYMALHLSIDAAARLRDELMIILKARAVA